MISRSVLVSQISSIQFRAISPPSGIGIISLMTITFYDISILNGDVKITEKLVQV